MPDALGPMIVCVCLPCRTALWCAETESANVPTGGSRTSVSGYEWAMAWDQGTTMLSGCTFIQFIQCLAKLDQARSAQPLFPKHRSSLMPACDAPR